jgi:hypothetical protein
MLPAHRIFWGLILLAAAGAGLLYNIIFAAGASPLAGFTYGLCMGATVLAFVRGPDPGRAAGADPPAAGAGSTCWPPNSLYVLMITLGLRARRPGRLGVRPDTGDEPVRRRCG